MAKTWAVGAAVHHDDPIAVGLLVDALRAAAGQVKQTVTDELAGAAANASSKVVAALLAAGADPETTDEHGVSALRLALRAGKNETAALLSAGGAPDDSTDVGATICEAAASAAVAGLRLMVDLGFSVHARNDSGEQPLHTAAYHGNAEAVRLLLDAGADVDARDGRFDATPLALATVGSGERAGQPGDWMDVVRLLVAAKASRDGVWIAEKPPSEAVIDLLLSYGIRPDDEAGPEDDGSDDRTLSLGTGMMAERPTARATSSIDRLGGCSFAHHVSPGESP